MKKQNRGITLIALVITIIVLLILAGVSIATLTGENGILTQADKAKNETAEGKALETVQVEVLGSYGTDGNISIDDLNKNLGNIDGLIYNGQALSDSNKIDSLPAIVTLDGYEIVIKSNYDVVIKETVEQAKISGKIFDNNTEIYDTYYNMVTIPAGFKIANDSATDVTGGVVIEDANYANTKGSQFVWIPVGTVYTNVEKTEYKTITLERYVFDSSGNIDKTLSIINPGDYLRTISTTSDYFIEGSKEEKTSNTHAEDIESFIYSAKTNLGYYIGRYEARKSTAENLTVVGTDSVYNNITQSDAAMKARSMYDENLTFTSDLINSYAWDTAIVFEQVFDDRTYKTSLYSIQYSLNTDLAPQGTNNLADIAQQDKICNIWDMASNCREWTTETSNSSSTPCVARAGWSPYGRQYTSYRCRDWTTWTYDYYSFRPLLYL